MLELLISLRREHGDGLIGGEVRDGKNVGDVICAKISPAVWGRLEHKDFLIVKHKDAALEEKVRTSDGVLSLPYAGIDGDGKKNRSKFKVKVAAFCARTRTNLEKDRGKKKQKPVKLMAAELQ